MYNFDTCTFVYMYALLHWSIYLCLFVLHVIVISNLHVIEVYNEKQKNTTYSVKNVEEASRTMIERDEKI